MTATEIQEIARTLGDADIAAHSQRFFKTGPGEYGEGDVFRGIRVPVLRKLARQYRQLPRPEVLTILSSAYHEDRLLALLILVQAFARGDDKAKSAIYQTYLGHTRWINNWDLVDASAHKIVGPYLEGRDRDPLYVLAQSASLWERRIAIMATLHYIRLGQFEDTLAIARLLLRDPEMLIHKAVGWMLREVGKRDREVEETFLRSHYRAMPRTMLRYAIERFPEPTRQAYLAGTIG